MPACYQCGNQVPGGNRFCGHCGAKQEISPSESPTPVVVEPPKVQARLVLVKGQGYDSASFRLSSSEHTIGRLYGSIVFPEDPFLSDKHAALFVKDNQYYIRDLQSENGVFIKLKAAYPLEDESLFLVGEQLLRLQRTRQYEQSEQAKEEDTSLYGCAPEERIYFKITQLFSEQQEGAVFYASGNNVSIGREQCDLSFPFDRHISGQHARVFLEADQCYLQDLGSKNGSFARIQGAHPLENGDYFFVGQQLLRIEVEHV